MNLPAGLFTLETVQIAVSMLCALLVVWAAICACNAMKARTNWFIRIAFVCLGAGAFAAFLSPLFYSRTPTAVELCLLVGLAFFLYSDRRRRHKLFHAC